MSSETSEPEGPIIRDKRRIDPATGQLRQPPPAAAAAVDTSTDDASLPEPVLSIEEAEAAVGAPDGRFELAAALAERTADLQRLQAEYVNYKRRVDRDRETGRQTAVSSVLVTLLPVLDDIGRAREHGELAGGFKAVAESLQRAVEVLGLESFGQPGEPFDPRVHEALMHSYSDEVDSPVCSAVLQVGFRHGDRVLRPARVAVTEPPSAELTEPAADDSANPSERSEPIAPPESDKSEDGAAEASGSQ